ncbi:MAG: hypothetical protein HYX53_11740 [Chloroflexi bacterium]|nr:hypothetical protein [Chloroflexota bacterium]
MRGKYDERYRSGINSVLLEKDVMAAFPDSEAVNRALRLLIEISKRATADPPPE